MFKKTLSIMSAVAVAAGTLFCCFSLSACGKGGNEEDKLEKVTAEQWKTTIDSSRSSESYSFDCVFDSQEYENGEKMDYFVKSDLKGRVDNVSDVTYYEFTDSGSVFPNGTNQSYAFGRFYFSGEDTNYVSFENADGSFGEWKRLGLGAGSYAAAADILNTMLSDDSLKFSVEKDNGETVELPLSELYDYFTFDEEGCFYYATLQQDYGYYEYDIKLSFKNGKIFNFDLITRPVVRHIAVNEFDDDDVDADVDDGYEEVTEHTTLKSYKFTFYNYGSTVVCLPDELKNL